MFSRKGGRGLIVKLVAFLAVLVMGTAVAAQHSQAAEISVACNDNGAVVTLPDRSKMYLGKQCDAYRPGVGNGRWWFATSAFLVEIEGETTRFARDLSCGALPYCRYQARQEETSKEVRSAADAASSVAERYAALRRQLLGLSYGDARSLLLKSLWEPVQNPAPGDLAFVARDMYDQGYVEVDACSPVGDAPCKFYFRNANRHYLAVSTSGENPQVAQVAVLDAEAFAETRSALWGE